MSLRIKILLPMLLVIAAFSTLLHLYWIPQFHQHYSEEIIKEQVAALEILASAIEDPLLSGDLGKLYATLQSIESQHPDWAHLNIQRMDGTQVYPLDTLESHHHSHTVISRTITQHDKPLFNIQLHINFEEKLNSSTQLFNDLEILFALLILPIVVVTIALQDKMIFMPLRALITASRGLTAGDYNTAIASGPRDETGELLNSFRQMRDAIVEREVKLLSSEERLKAIFENVTNGIVTTDASGYIVSSNLAFQTIFDYRDHELEGRHISELIPEVDSLLQQLEHTANHESHARRGCCSGETVGSDRNAKPLALEVTFNQVMLNNSPMVLGVIEEISERLQQRAREERYHQLANTRATIAQILQKGQTTLEQRLVLALNRLFAIDPLVAYRRGAIISRDTQGGGLTILASTGSFLPEELEALRDDGVTQTLYERISASGEALISGNCTDQHGRRSAPVEPHGHYIIPMNYSGTTHGLLYLYTDATPDTASDITAFLQQIAEMLALAITENNAIIALTEARDRAEQHAQAKSNFLANMSHEIRTPLNGVLGSLELLIDGELSEEQRAYATTAFRSSELLLRLINDILDISKFESGHLKIEAIEFDLIDMVEELLALFSSAAVKKGINISWTLDQGIAPTFVGDRTRLLQILGNLVSNAIKFTDRGEIRIDIRREERDERGELLMFSITDTGMGIDKADQQRIFGEFEQVDSSTTRRFGGTGLGLSICRKLTQIMGGDIGLVSTPGEGSTFWFTLHLPFGEAPNAAQKAHSYANIRALIVDTTPTQFNVIQHILRDAAVECSHASNSAQTFSLIDDSLANGYLFDLIIIDHQMASEDGANVAVDIASTYPDYSAAIILHTAAQDSIYTELSRNHALDTVIRKPLRRGFLYQQLAILSGQSRPEEGTLRESGHEQTLSRLRERKVLLVDDNTVNRMVARAMLNKVGITPDTAVNGLNAVNLYKQHHYDLILMDLQMPVMNGFDATAAIREHERQAAHNASYIIALTANALEGSRERCLDAGMDNYLAKPFTMAELLDAISRPVLTTTTAPSQSPTTAPSQHPTTAQQEGGGRSDHHPVVSEAVFEQLQSLFGADGHAMALSSFCIDSSSKIMKLRESDGSSDEAGTVQHRIIHSLKGSSGNLGMARLHHHYLALERQLKEGGGLLSGAEIDELEVLQRLSCSEYEKKLKKSA